MDTMGTSRRLTADLVHAPGAHPSAREITVPVPCAKRFGVRCQGTALKRLNAAVSHRFAALQGFRPIFGAASHAPRGAPMAREKSGDGDPVTIRGSDFGPDP